MKRKLLVIPLLFFMLYGCYGCTMLGMTQDKGMKGLLFAKNEITHLAEQYEASYQAASITAQLNWQNEIDPLFLRADEIIKEWEFLLNIGEDPSDIRQQYIMIRNEILENLVDIKEG